MASVSQGMPAANRDAWRGIIDYKALATRIAPILLTIRRNAPRLKLLTATDLCALIAGCPRCIAQGDLQRQYTATVKP